MERAKEKGGLSEKEDRSRPGPSVGLEVREAALGRTPTAVGLIISREFQEQSKGPKKTGLRVLIQL